MYLGLALVGWKAALGAVLILACAVASAATVTKRKLGPNINTDAREIGVAASPDGRFLYIVREDEPLTAAEAERVRGRTKDVDTACRQVVELKDKLPLS